LGKDAVKRRPLARPLEKTGQQRPEHPDYAPVNFKQAKKETSGQQAELL